VYMPAGEGRDLIDAYAGTLASICIVSAFGPHPGDAAPTGAMTSDVIPELKVQVRRAPGLKCVRCWRWQDDVGQHPEHPLLCGRCVAQLA
jgi:isoleucyl-tRNA synthetase